MVRDSVSRVSDDLTFRAATERDVDRIVALVQSAYRGDDSRQGWTTEADLLDGQRTDADEVRSLIVPDRSSRILLGERGGALVASCYLEDRRSHSYFGMFAVDPHTQGSGLGRQVLAEAERIAREEWRRGEQRMTVIRQREDLIAWYVRRGYRRTGILTPFPYSDERFGLPKRDDLAFEELRKSL